LGGTGVSVWASRGSWASPAIRRAMRSRSVTRWGGSSLLGPSVGMSVPFAGIGAGGVGIGPAELGQDSCLERFHDRGVFRGDMIVSEEMQKAMNQQMAEMPVKWAFHGLGVPHRRFIADSNVAQMPGFARNFRAVRWERKHVGWLVDSAP